MKKITGLLFAALVFVPLLSGCGVLSQPDPAPLVSLRLPLPDLALCERAQAGQVTVALPEPGIGLRGDRVALLFNDREVRYLADAKWESEVPALFQRQLVRYLNATGCFSGVGTDSGALQSDLLLQSDLERLHLLFEGEEIVPTAEIRLRLELVNAEKGQVLDKTEIRYAEKAAGPELEALLQSLDNVAYRALLDAASWTSQTAGQERQPKNKRNKKK